MSFTVRPFIVFFARGACLHSGEAGVWCGTQEAPPVGSLGLPGRLQVWTPLSCSAASASLSLSYSLTFSVSLSSSSSLSLSLSLSLSPYVPPHCPLFPLFAPPSLSFTLSPSLVVRCSPPRSFAFWAGMTVERENKELSVSVSLSLSLSLFWERHCWLYPRIRDSPLSH